MGAQETLGECIAGGLGDEIRELAASPPSKDEESKCGKPWGNAEPEAQVELLLKRFSEAGNESIDDYDDMAQSPTHVQYTHAHTRVPIQDFQRNVVRTHSHNDIEKGGDDTARGGAAAYPTRPHTDANEQVCRLSEFIYRMGVASEQNPVL